MSWDEPPDNEPPQCPYCEEPLGYNTAKCEHCRINAEFDKLTHEHHALKHKLACRCRALLALPFAEGGVQPSVSHMSAVGALVHLAGLPVPAEFVKHATANAVAEYGDAMPYRVTDAELVDRFLNWTLEAGRQERAAGTFTAAMLDTVPRTTADQLWFGESGDGLPRVFSDAEKRQGLGTGSSTQWGATVRHVINMALERQLSAAAFWLEFYGDYLRVPAGPIKPGARVSYVVGIEAYTAHVGEHKDVPRHHLGFGGDKFVVLLKDGREFMTDSNWGRGTVPLALRKLITSNAVFKPREQPAPPEDTDVA